MIARGTAVESSHTTPPQPILPSRARRAITWLGHSSVAIDLDGARLMTDPVLRRRIGPLVRIAGPPDDSLVGTVHGVLLSHLHADHADLRSLRSVAADVPLVAPHEAADWLRRSGLRDVREAGVGQTLTVAGLHVLATRAAHDRRRGPVGPQADPLGYVIRGSISVYFAGDTDLFEEMSALRGLVDVALLPVWGWGPSVGAGHLDPDRAAQAAELISPRIAIPIHWGTYAIGWPARRPSDPQRPAREFAALTARRAPSVEVRLLAVGETTEV
jgi:L-ascorbate metabolism protein UlaG (beta-lactamase superfamily)